MKTIKLDLLQRNALACLLGAIAIILIGGTAHAEEGIDFDDEVSKINTMNATIGGVVTGMTDVAILPMGLSASMRTFRHIVLNNV